MAPGVTLGGEMMVSQQVFGQLLCFVAMPGFLLVLAVFTRPCWGTARQQQRTHIAGEDADEQEAPDWIRVDAAPPPHSKEEDEHDAPQPPSKEEDEHNAPPTREPEEEAEERAEEKAEEEADEEAPARPCSSSTSMRSSSPPQLPEACSAHAHSSSSSSSSSS